VRTRETERTANRPRKEVEKREKMAGGGGLFGLRDGKENAKSS